MSWFFLKDEEGITITKASQKFRDKYRRKLNVKYGYIREVNFTMDQ